MAEPASKLTDRLWDEASRTKNNYRRDLLREAAVALEQAEKDANTYRIEADCALRDCDGLELDVGLLRDALARIAEGRPNKTFDPWARDVARGALAALKGENV